MIGRNVCSTARKQHWEDAVFADRFVQRRDQVLLWNRSLCEELLHQLVLTFGNQLDQRFMRLFCLLRNTGRNLACDLASAIAIRRVMERLHRDEVYDTMKSARIRDGQLHRNAVASPSLVQILNQSAQPIASTRFWVIHLVALN